MKRIAALLSFLVLPLAEATETGPIGFESAVEQLRSAVGAWDVKTTQYGEGFLSGRFAACQVTG
jgi:hypothetical protein